MSVRTLHCPGCQIPVNVPAAMTNVRCPKCGTIWNANAPQPVRAPSPATTPAGGSESDSAEKSKEIPVALVGSFIAAAMAFLAVIGILISFFFAREETTSSPSTSPTVAEETIKPSTPQPYRTVKLPEEQRHRIYDDYRAVAKTTVEKPLAIPQGTKVRANLEVMLDQTFERELSHFAALHDIPVDDVKEIIKEGDAKNWDPTPRSHAVRDGKRVYDEEMSEGWELKKNK